MFAVKTYYNTEADGSLVEESRALEDRPITYHGPFDSMTQAISWMDNDWPDGDTDVVEQVADDFDIPSEWLNDPASIFGDIPDEDIRTDGDTPEAE